MTDGDMLSHRAMYYGLLKGFPNLNVISEEDDPEPIDMSTVDVPKKTDSGVDAIISDGDDVLVPIDEVDVWIDPLDATQEVSVFSPGMSRLLIRIQKLFSVLNCLTLKG